MKQSVGDQTLWGVLQARARRVPAAPLVTYYDLATGERIELSAASVENAVAKTAGLLRDELDVQPGDTVAVRLPLHWQRAVWQAACSAVAARYDPAADPSTAHTLVTDRDHLDLAGLATETVIVSLAPFGLPSGEPLPVGIVDHATAARAHPDVFIASAGPGPEPLMQEAAALIQSQGRLEADRILVLEDDPHADLLILAVPLRLGGAAVIVRHATGGDVEAVAAAERVTAR